MDEVKVGVAEYSLGIHGVSHLFGMSIQFCFFYTCISHNQQTNDPNPL